MLTLRGVSLVRDGVRLLCDVGLTIERGERLVILGPNGAGKTLLMQVAHRLLAPTKGEVIDTARPVREAMVFQRPILLRRSVIENVLYAIDHARPVRSHPTPDTVFSPASPADPEDSRDTRRVRAEAALRMVGLEALANRPARVLSGGEQQRVALARAAALRPDLIWFDEPTASLDPASTLTIEAIVMRMSSEGTTCVLSTHDIGQARRLGQRILLMAAGRVVETTAAAQFFRQPATAAGRRYLRGELLND